MPMPTILPHNIQALIEEIDEKQVLPRLGMARSQPGAHRAEEG